VLRLRLDRPERRNALDRPLLEALIDAFAAPDAQVVVLGSTSRGAFCAGADLRIEDSERAAVSDLLYELYGRMTGCDAIVVTALGGPAVGGGAQLAIAADLRVAGPDARIQVAGPGHGLAVAAWGLPSLVGRGRAMDLCLTMRSVGADEALAIGLVDRVVADADAASLELAAQLAALDGKVQLTVKGTYDEQALMRAIVKRSPPVAQLRERIRGMPEAAAHFQRIQLGELVAAEVERERERDAALLLEPALPRSSSRIGSSCASSARCRPTASPPSRRWEPRRGADQRNPQAPALPGAGHGVDRRAHRRAGRGAVLR
jgi:enoyl-CoA hydratase/carnithine racemase